MFQQFKKFIWILFIFVLGLSACASQFTTEPDSAPPATFTAVAPSPTSEPMALTVNGEGVTVLEFDAEVQRYISSQAAAGIEVTPINAADAVIQNYIPEILLSQGARANGFELADPELQSRMDSLAAELGGADFLLVWENEHGYNDQTFRFALKRAAEAAWMRDQILATVPLSAEQIHIQQMLLPTEEKAQSFLQQLNDGADFNDLALIADPVTRGDLGWLPHGYLLNTQIEQAAFVLERGEYSDVIATDVGFHIVRILDRDPDRLLSPEALIVLQEAALKSWVDEHKQAADVKLAPQ